MLPTIVATIRNRWSTILLALVFFGVGFFAHYRYQLHQTALLTSLGPTSLGQIRQSTLGKNTYRFIDPLFACDITSRKAVTELFPLKTKIEELIANKIHAGQLKNASVYFDTRDGRWLGINTAETFFPASLMKVPTLIAFLKVAQEDPNILSKKIYYDGSFNLNTLEYFKPQKSIQPKHSYTVQELLESMIKYSDNNALPLLLKSIDSKTLAEVYTDLGVSIPEDTNDSLADFMPIKSYVSFFRVLYNSSYLSRDMSESALALLSQASFRSGIKDGVPDNILVAQKFGERNFGTDPTDTKTEKGLHDCGIVYFPDRPYLLCVMTKGNDFDKLAATISDISKLVYQFMSETTGP